MQTEKRVRRRQTWAGVNALATELGLDKGFVSKVLNGRRRSARVEAAARARGWRAPAAENRES